MSTDFILLYVLLIATIALVVRIVMNTPKQHVKIVAYIAAVIITAVVITLTLFTLY